MLAMLIASAFMASVAIFILIKINVMQRQMLQQSERLRVVQETQNQIPSQIGEHLMRSFDLLRGQLLENLNQGSKQTNACLQQMTAQTAQHLQEISGQVDKRLAEGFEKTTSTLQDVIKGLI